MRDQSLSVVFRRTIALTLFLVTSSLPLHAWAVDSDGDGVDDSVDAFPNNPEATTDTDHDGLPDSINMAKLQDLGSFLGPFSLSAPFSHGVSVPLTSVWTTPASGTVAISVHPGNQTCLASCQLDSYITVTVNVPAGRNGIITFQENFAGSGQYLFYDNGTALVSRSNVSFSGMVSYVLAAGNHNLDWVLRVTCSGLSGCKYGDLSLSNLVTQTFGASSLVIADADDDNDGSPDTSDKFPLNAAASVDTDSDGLPDNWNQPNPYGCAAEAASCNGLTLDQSVPQSITISQAAPTSRAYGTSFTVAATASSGLPVNIAGSGGCSGSGTGSASITMISGTLACAVTYSQPGGGRYLPATNKVSSTTATKATQVITVTQAAPTSAAYGSSFTVAATASSGLAVSITGSGGCSRSANTLTMTSSTTTCTVTYSQAGDSNYSAAANKSSNTTATKANQSITVTQPAPASAAYGSSFDVAATASSGLLVNIAASGGCSIAGNTVTMTGDNCQLLYSQAGDANYNAVSPMTSSTTVLSNLPLDGAYKGSAVQEQANKP